MWVRTKRPWGKARASFPVSCAAPGHQPSMYTTSLSAVARATNACTSGVPSSSFEGDSFTPR